MPSDLDFIMVQVAAMQEIRDAELREAFRDPQAMKSLLLRDCAELVSSIGGYVAPVDRQEKQEWVIKMMNYDAPFRAKVMATLNLVQVYMDTAMEFYADQAEITRKVR